MEGSSQELNEFFDERSAIKQSYSQEFGGEKTNKGLLGCLLPKRYILAVMAFLGFCNIYALRANLSVAIVAMTANRTVTVNETELVLEPEFYWDSETRGLILGAFFYGYIVTQLPGGILASRIGGKNVFAGGVFLTALLSLFTPLLARWNVYTLIILRVFEGLFEGVTYPAIHAIWAKWAPPLEKTRLATIAFSGSYIGLVICMPLSGILVNSPAGWPSLFYLFGSLAILWYVFWCYLVTETPSEHTTISNEELEYIQQSIGYGAEQTKRLSPPWLKIITSLPVMAIVMAHFAENWGFYTWLTELPSFMYDAMNFDLEQAGFLAALPYLLMAIVVQVGGYLADCCRAYTQLTTTMVRKLFTCTAFLVQAVFLVAAGFMMTPAAGMACLTIAVGLGGFAWSGFSVNHLDIAPQYASILMGISNTFATIPGMISPSISGFIVTHQTAGEWRIVFYIVAAIYIVGALFYALAASGERQKWAETPIGYIPYDDYSEPDQGN